MGHVCMDLKCLVALYYGSTYNNFIKLFPNFMDTKVFGGVEYNLEF